ncbi:hypothetical protein NHQ30_009107 [Ciborinia camelliae]|nr:hypothetical protein NHQ30_009107 [Ciborinia camelliae]
MSVALNSISYANGLVSSSAILTSVFKDTITEANFPARAVQAYRTILLRATYHELTDRMPLNTSVRTTLFESALVPHGSRGYFIVVAILTNSPQTEDILKRATLATYDVKNWVRSHNRQVSQRNTTPCNAMRVFKRPFWHRRKDPPQRYLVEGGIFVPAQQGVSLYQWIRKQS